MTFTDNNLSATATYTYEVATVNWSDVSGPKSNTLTLKNGVVSVAAPRSEKIKVANRSQVSLMYTGSRDAFTGPVALYDIRGKLLATTDVPDGLRRDIRGLLGHKTDNLVVARFPAK
jgi:hypothetical protein